MARRFGLSQGQGLRLSARIVDDAASRLPCGYECDEQVLHLEIIKSFKGRSDAATAGGSADSARFGLGVCTSKCVQGIGLPSGAHKHSPGGSIILGNPALLESWSPILYWAPNVFER